MIRRRTSPRPRLRAALLPLFLLAALPPPAHGQAPDRETPNRETPDRETTGGEARGAPPAVAASPVAAPLRVVAAAPLRTALTEAIEAFRQGAPTAPIGVAFGGAPAVAARIAAGDGPDLFLSAGMAPAAALAEAQGRPAVLLARDRLCVLVRQGLLVEEDGLLDRLLNRGTRLAIAPPGSDPAGDDALALFARAEAVRTGARVMLEEKALRLVGSPPPPPGQLPEAAPLATDRADLVLARCSAAAAAARQVAGARVLPLPAELAVVSAYGMAVLSDRPEASRLALFLLSPEGQAILALRGFEAPLRPEP
ncbi:substrate-binding domain-containing protein [Roseomonas sp. NAR14]|uniref:Substrate-binding domain-containing protein n=1 Tax=Roseomonas acroporae TaxID=2937791 RepID=A0A9X2BTY1_9PROT|nr:substrate-binding domain-containing protein [Roseomonas acroporae]MCK8784812.1 substrate-binding domain-containing protein [Roseomonas acroporae]